MLKYHKPEVYWDKILYNPAALSLAAWAKHWIRFGWGGGGGGGEGGG